MGFVKPPQWLYGMSYGLLRIMALVNRYILMPRNTPKSVVPHNGQGLMDGVDAADPQDIFSVCPASGIRAGEENGKMCPVGGAQKQKAMMQKRPKPRLTPNWVSAASLKDTIQKTQSLTFGAVPLTSPVGE